MQMQSNNQKNRSQKVFWILINIIFIWIVANLILDTMFVKKDNSKLKLIKKLEAYEIMALEKKNSQLKEEIKNVEDLERIEKISREKLDMKKTGEKIYRLVD